MAYPERIIPDEDSPGIVAIHEKRYRFALPQCAGKDVLDAACGVGYGSALLATSAAHVMGVDLSPEAIDYARSRYGGPNVDFRVGDLLALDLPDASFDVVCSFETIEHLPDRDAYLRHVTRVLRDGGMYFVSTPRAERTNESPGNPYHCVEFDRHDFEALLRRYFDQVELYGQRRLETRRHRLLRRLDVVGLRKRVALLRKVGGLASGTAPTEDVSAEGIVIDCHDIDRATELVAVCRGPRRP